MVLTKERHAPNLFSQSNVRRWMENVVGTSKSIELDLKLFKIVSFCDDRLFERCCVGVKLLRVQFLLSIAIFIFKSVLLPGVFLCEFRRDKYEDLINTQFS